MATLVVLALLCAPLVVVLSAAGVAEAGGGDGRPALLPQLAAYVEARTTELDQIPDERKALLEELASYIARRVASGEPAGLNFICTHNSRRSHMGQLWAAAAAAHYGLPGVRTYSGGTEWTAFNPRAVAAMSRAGFDVTRTTDDANPIYHVRYSNDMPPSTCFSKVFSSAPNPREGFAAVMVCSDADENCPAVLGAGARISLPFIDPKISDGTPEEAATYDERCAQIAREILFAFSRASE